MPQADWVHLAEEIVAQIRAKRHDKSVTFTLTELLQRSGADAEPDGYRTRGFWAQCQRGDPYWRSFRNAGLVLGFQPDESGRPVESVTFRLDRIVD